MSHYLVYYKDDNGREDYEHYYAESKTIAQQLFEHDYPEIVIRVDNASLEEAGGRIATSLIGLMKKSNNPTEKMIGLLSKPVAHISVVLLREYDAHIHGEYNLHSRAIAKKIYDRL